MFCQITSDLDICLTTFASHIIKGRKGEKNDPFQDQYDHRLRSLLAPYYGTEQYRRITSRAFTGKYGGVFPP